MRSREAGARATLSVDATDGDPSPGSMKVDAPFDAYNQFIDVQHNYGTLDAQELGRRQAAREGQGRVGRQPEPTNPMGVQPYVNTGAAYNYCGNYLNLIAGGGWNKYVLDLTTCTTARRSVDGHRLRRSFQAGDGLTGGRRHQPDEPTAATSTSTASG